MNRIRLTAEVINFLETYGVTVEMDGQTWVHYPFWLHKDADGMLELVEFDKLPQAVATKKKAEQLQGKLKALAGSFYKIAEDDSSVSNAAEG